MGVCSTVGDAFGSGGEKPADITPGFNTQIYANNGAQQLTAQQQQAFINALMAQSQGHGAVQQLLQNQAQQNQAANYGQAAAARGVNPALAMRNAQLANVGLQQGANQAGVQAQLASQGQLGSALGQMRAQDIQNSGLYNDLAFKYLNANQGQQSTNAGRAAAGISTVAGAIAPASQMFSKATGVGGGGGPGAAQPYSQEVVAQGGMIGSPSIPIKAPSGQIMDKDAGPQSLAGKHFKMAKSGMIKMADGGSVYGAGGNLGSNNNQPPDAAQTMNYLQSQQNPNNTPMANNNLQALMMEYARQTGAQIQPNAAIAPQGVSPKADPMAPMGQQLAPTGGVAPRAGGQAMPIAQGAQATAGMPQHVFFADGGTVPALVSPGERYLPPAAVKQVAQGKKSPMKAGSKIPGKPVVGGAKNDYANDTVSKKLEKGGIVIPRSITQGDDAEEKAHAFISAILAHQGLK